MSSPARLPPLSLPEVLSPQSDQAESQEGLVSPDLMSCSSVSLALNSPEGINCFGNERLLLQDQARFCNNEKLSDVTLLVGGNKYYAHKMILVRASDVFERMLTGAWTDSGKLVYHSFFYTVFLYICYLAAHKYVKC